MSLTMAALGHGTLKHFALQQTSLGEPAQSNCHQHESCDIRNALRARLTVVDLQLAAQEASGDREAVAVAEATVLS